MLSDYAHIPESTIKSWFSPQKIDSGNPVYPRLSTLDKLCDALEIHTSDLFILTSDFSHPYISNNNSLRRFNTILIEFALKKDWPLRIAESIIYFLMKIPIQVLWSSIFVTLRPNFCYRIYATP